MMINKVCPCNCVANCSECELEEKKLKAFDIIKRIGFDDVNFIRYVSYEEYCECRINPISKEEFDLLKEVLL